MKISTALRQIRRKHEDEMTPRCGVSGTKGAHEHHLVTAKSWGFWDEDLMQWHVGVRVHDVLTGIGWLPV